MGYLLRYRLPFDTLRYYEPEIYTKNLRHIMINKMLSVQFFCAVLLM